MNQFNNHGTSLPHHRLLAYKTSLELLAAVRSAQIRDAKLRDEALRDRFLSGSGFGWLRRCRRRAAAGS